MENKKFLKENLENMKEADIFKNFIENALFGCNILINARETSEYFLRPICEWESTLHVVYDDYSINIVDEITEERTFWSHATYCYQKAFLQFLIKKDKEEGRKYFEGLEKFIESHIEEGKVIRDELKEEIFVLNGLLNLENVKFPDKEVKEFNKDLKIDKLFLNLYQSAIEKQEESCIDKKDENNNEKK